MTYLDHRVMLPHSLDERYLIGRKILLMYAKWVIHDKLKYKLGAKRGQVVTFNSENLSANPAEA